MRYLFSLLAPFLLIGCATKSHGNDPFDVALGMAAAQIMADETANPDALMKAYSAAVAQPTVIQQTVVQEAPKPQQGGGQ